MNIASIAHKYGLPETTLDANAERLVLSKGPQKAQGLAEDLLHGAAMALAKYSPKELSSLRRDVYFSATIWPEKRSVVVNGVITFQTGGIVISVE